MIKIAPEKIPCLVEGAYGEANFGDDLLMYVTGNILLRHFSVSQVGFSVRDIVSLSYPSSVVAGAQIYPPESKYRLVPALTTFGGGTQFYSFPKQKSDRPLSRDNFVTRLVKKLKDEGAAKFVLRHLFRRVYKSGRNAFLGLGIGPFLDGNEDLVKGIVASGDFVAVRDDESMHFCKKWKVDAILGADLCFLTDYWLKLIDIDISNNNTNNSAAGCGKKIGFVVRDFPYDLPSKEYLEPLMLSAKELRRQGYNVDFLVFSVKKDAGLIKNLISLGESPLVWDPTVTSISGYLNVLNSLDFIVSTRYHGILISAILGKPGVAVPVDPKLLSISRALKGGYSVWDVPFDPMQLVDLVNDGFTNYTDRCLRVASGVKDEQVRAEAMLRHFDSFIEKIN